MLAVEICGQMYVSMSEVRSAIYPGVTSSTLRSTMSRLGINTVLASGAIRSTFESQLGQRTGTGRGGHYLMSLADLNKMISKRKPTRAIRSVPEEFENELKTDEDTSGVPYDNSKGDTDNDILQVEDLSTYCGQPLGSNVDDGQIQIDLNTFALMESNVSNNLPKPLQDERMLRVDTLCRTEDETRSVEITEAERAGKIEESAIPKVCNNGTTPAKSASPENSSAEIKHNLQRGDELTAAKKSTARGQTVCLDEELEEHLKDLTKFYTKVINPLRPTSYISESTMHRHERRIRLFLDFVSKECKQKPSIEDSLDIALTSKYVDHLSGFIGSGTVANHVQSIIILAKYVLINVKKRDQSNATEIAHLRHMQAQLQVHSHQSIFVHQ